MTNIATQNTEVIESNTLQLENVDTFYRIIESILLHLAFGFLIIVVGFIVSVLIAGIVEAIFDRK